MTTAAEKNLGLGDHDITVVRASALESPGDYPKEKNLSTSVPVEQVEYNENGEDENRKKKAMVAYLSRTRIGASDYPRSAARCGYRYGS